MNVSKGVVLLVTLAVMSIALIPTAGIVMAVYLYMTTQPAGPDATIVANVSVVVIGILWAIISVVALAVFRNW